MKGSHRQSSSANSKAEEGTSLKMNAITTGEATAREGNHNNE
jgi:hypothetical protein